MASDDVFDISFDISGAISSSEKIIQKLDQAASKSSRVGTALGESFKNIDTSSLDKLKATVDTVVSATEQLKGFREIRAFSITNADLSAMEKYAEHFRQIINFKNELLTRTSNVSDLKFNFDSMEKYRNELKRLQDELKTLQYSKISFDPIDFSRFESELQSKINNARAAIKSLYESAQSYGGKSTGPSSFINPISSGEIGKDMFGLESSIKNSFKNIPIIVQSEGRIIKTEFDNFYKNLHESLLSHGFTSEDVAKAMGFDSSLENRIATAMKSYKEATSKITDLSQTWKESQRLMGLGTKNLGAGPSFTSIEERATMGFSSRLDEGIITAMKSFKEARSSVDASVKAIKDEQTAITQAESAFNRFNINFITGMQKQVAAIEAASKAKNDYLKWGNMGDYSNVSYIPMNKSNLEQYDKSFQNILPSIPKVNSAFESLGRIASRVFEYSMIWRFQSALIEIPGDIFNCNVKMDELRTTFNGVFGNTGVEKLQYSMNLAYNYAKSIESVSESYKKFSISADYLGMSGSNTKMIFESVMQAMTKVGASSSDINNAFRAIEQMLAKGTVTAEEFKRQFAQYIPGAMKMGAEAAGVTTSEFIKMMRSGQIISTEFLPNFARSLQTFAIGWQDSTKNISSNWERLKNDMMISFENSQLTSVLSGVTSTLDDILHKYNQYEELTNRISSARNSRSIMSVAGLYTGGTDYNDLKEFNDWKKEWDDKTLEDRIDAITKALERLREANKSSLEVSINSSMEVNSAYKELSNQLDKDLVKKYTRDINNEINQIKIVSKEISDSMVLGITPKESDIQMWDKLKEKLTGSLIPAIKNLHDLIGRKIDVEINTKQVEQLEELLKSLTEKDYKVGVKLFVDKSSLDNAVAGVTKNLSNLPSGKLESGEKELKEQNVVLARVRAEKEALIKNNVVKESNGQSVTFEDVEVQKKYNDLLKQEKDINLAIFEQKKENRKLAIEAQLYEFNSNRKYVNKSMSDYSNIRDKEGVAWEKYQEKLISSGIKYDFENGSDEVKQRAISQWAEAAKVYQKDLVEAATQGLNKSQKNNYFLQELNKRYIEFFKETQNDIYEMGATGKNHKWDCSHFTKGLTQSVFSSMDKSFNDVNSSDILEAFNKGGPSDRYSSNIMHNFMAKGNYATFNRSQLENLVDTAQIGMYIGFSSKKKDGTTDFTHIGTIVEGINGIKMILQSSLGKGGVNMTPLSEYLKGLSSKYVSFTLVDPIPGKRGAFSPTLKEQQSANEYSSKQSYDAEQDLVSKRLRASGNDVAAALEGVSSTVNKKIKDIDDRIADYKAKGFDTSDLEKTKMYLKEAEAVEKQRIITEADTKAIAEHAKLLEQLANAKGTPQALREAGMAGIQNTYQKNVNAINKSSLSSDAKTAQLETAEYVKQVQEWQLKIKTAESFDEYYNTFINDLKQNDKMYYENIHGIYESVLNDYIANSKEMVEAARKAYGEIDALAKKTGNKELENRNSSAEEKFIKKQLTDITENGEPLEAFWAQMSLNYKTYQTQLQRTREQYVTFAKSIKELTNSIEDSVASSITDIVKGWASGTLNMKDVWSSLLGSLGNAFASFAQNILKMWMDNILSNIAKSLLNNSETATTGILGSILGKSSSSFFSIFGFANGGGFSSPTGLPTNSIISSPTFFPIHGGVNRAFASGAMGVAGEAGPELIMPAVPMSGNQMGVRVQIPTSTSSSKKTSGSSDNSGIKIANFFDKRLMGDFLKTSEGERLVVNMMVKNGFKRT